MPLKQDDSTFLYSFIYSFRLSQAPDAPPPTKWYIDTPEFSADRLNLFLKYPISDMIPHDNLEWSLLTDCSGGTDVTENNYLAVEMQMEDESVPEGDGTKWRFVTLSFTFDPNTIRSSPIITTVDLEDRMQFCVRLGGYSAPTIVPGALEIVFKETTLDVVIQQDGQADPENSVVVVETQFDSDQQGSQLYQLRGFLCNETNHEIIDPIPIYQGTLTKVCVTPTEEALANGVFMHSIDSFFWTRETIYQASILPNQAVEPFAKVNCEPGMKVCSFVTLLKSDFFYRLGRVVGAGVGWLQVSGSCNLCPKKIHGGGNPIPHCFLCFCFLFVYYYYYYYCTTTVLLFLFFLPVGTWRLHRRTTCFESNRGIRKRESVEQHY